MEGKREGRGRERRNGGEDRRVIDERKEGEGETNRREDRRGIDEGEVRKERTDERQVERGRGLRGIHKEEKEKRGEVEGDRDMREMKTESQKTEVVVDDVQRVDF